MIELHKFIGDAQSIQNYFTVGDGILFLTELNEIEQRLAWIQNKIGAKKADDVDHYEGVCLESRKQTLADRMSLLLPYPKPTRMTLN